MSTYRTAFLREPVLPNSHEHLPAGFNSNGQGAPMSTGRSLDDGARVGSVTAAPQTLKVPRDKAHTDYAGKSPSAVSPANQDHFATMRAALCESDLATGIDMTGGRYLRTV